MADGENDNDENNPLMGKKEPSSDSEYKETQKFCCFPLKCGIIFFGILIILDIIFESLNLYFIAENENFDISYPIVYGIILIPILAAAILYILYFIIDDSPQTRACLPIAFLMVIIA